MKARQEEDRAGIPDAWEPEHKAYQKLLTAEKKARLGYRRTVDNAYDELVEVLAEIQSADALAAAGTQIDDLERVIREETPEAAEEIIREAERALNDVAGSNDIRSPLSKARRSKDDGDIDEAIDFLNQAKEAYASELAWRQAAQGSVLEPLAEYEETIRNSIGLRKQSRMPREIALEVAACQSHHKDISLEF